MASISISGVRKNYPGKRDAEAAAAIASEDESIVIIVRYKLFPDKDYSNFGLCYRAEEADNYYFNTNLHDVETIYDRRKQSLNIAVNFLERGINEPEFRSKINNFKDKKEKMEFIKNEGYEFTPKELENVAYELMRRASPDKKQNYFWWWDDGHGHKNPWDGSYYDESYFGEGSNKANEDDVVSKLIKELGNRYYDKRMAAAKLLSQMDDSASAIEPLIASMENEDWETREAAATALGDIADDRAFDVLMHAFLQHLRNEGEYSPCRAAIEALGKVGNSSAVGDLIQAFCNKEITNGLRQAAALALGRIGDSRALDPLKIASKDKNENYYVREAASEALDIFPK